jgi:membrane fusion protein, multidrug efflux system
MSERLRFSKGRWFFILGLIVAVPVAGYYGFQAWAYYATHVTTDNAYVQADMAQITPRVQGTVAEVLVKDNWWVHPGQVLARLDPRDYEVRLAEARAGLTRAREMVDELFAAVTVAEERRKATQAQVAAAQAEVAVAQADFRQAELDFRRAQQLFTDEVLAAHQFDRAKTQYYTAQSRLEARKRQLEEAKRTEAMRARELDQARVLLGNVTASERSEHSLVKQAEAAVHEAELNLSYCTLAAPIEGVVSKKAVEVGQRVQPGQPLMAIVPLHDIYIEANYKEAQLTHVRVGQPVTIEADIYPGYIYRGTVESLSAGTGAVFSLLPPENATGNWVKVVQRLPVKITLEEAPPADKPLRVGLSVEVSVNISNREGPLVRSLLQEQAQAKTASAATRAQERSSWPTTPLDPEMARHSE